MKKDDYKGILVVPIEIIPEQMSIEQFCEGIKKKDSVVTELVDKHCYYV